MDNKNIYNEVDRIPYTYLIGWTKFNIWYYGVRYRKGCHPNDLWVKYFTSSKFVKEFIKEHGEPDIIQVRHVFCDRHKAQDWESKVIRRMNMVKSPHFLNKRDPKGTFHNVGGVPFTEEHKEKIRLSNTGKRKNNIGQYKKSEETKEKMRKSSRERVANGTHSSLGPANNQKRIDAGTHNFLGGEFQRKLAQERVRNGTNPFLGGEIQRVAQRKLVEEGKHHLQDKEKASERAKKKLKQGTHPSQIKSCCVYCKKEINLLQLGNYHGDNCLFGPLFNSFLLIVFKINVLLFYSSIL